jgi:UPF0716 family protein affecting phage T7 exclusion
VAETVDPEERLNSLIGVMITLFFCALSFVAGVAVGALSYRNNAARAASLEAKAKSLADEFK